MPREPLEFRKPWATRGSVNAEHRKYHEMRDLKNDRSSDMADSSVWFRLIVLSKVAPIASGYHLRTVSGRGDGARDSFIMCCALLK